MTIRTRRLISAESFISPRALLTHWQGHRRLTRLVIESFPEEDFLHYSIAGMRPFSEMVLELLEMTTPGIWGIFTGEWDAIGRLIQQATRSMPDSKEKFLRRWDEVSELIDTLWPQIPAGRFQENERGFGQYEGPVYGMILYWMDSEIYYRGQAYIYLRSLGIEPPEFGKRD